MIPSLSTFYSESEQASKTSRAFHLPPISDSFPPFSQCITSGTSMCISYPAHPWPSAPLCSCSQRITSGTIMYIGQCKEFHGQAVHKLAAALQEDMVAAPSGLMKVAVW